LSSILGVLLAMAFVSGSLIAVDSAARGTLEAILGQLNGDYTVSASLGGLEALNLSADLRTVPGVIEVSPLGYIPLDRFGLWNSSVAWNYTDFVSVYVADPTSLPMSLRDASLQGTMDLANGTVVLFRDLARATGAGIGGTVYVGQEAYDPFTGNVTWEYVNLTVEGIVEVPQTPCLKEFCFGGPYFGSSFVLIGPTTLEWLLSRFPSLRSAYWTIEVWIDVGRFVNPYDLEASRRNLARMERNLSVAAARYGAWVYNGISSALSNYESAIGAQRLLLFLGSAPVILLGLYLGAVGIDLSHAERRRELAVLKARGAGRKQIIGLLTLEAILGGLLAALLGLVIGALLSRFLIESANAFSFYGPVRRDYFFIHRDTIIAVFALGTMLSAVASYRSARRTASLPVVETLRYYAPGETKIQYRPTLDVVMVCFAVLGYTGFLLSRAVPSSFLLFFLAPVLALMIPVAPVLLLIGTIRLLTRATGKVYEWASLVFKPFAKNLHHVISRNLSRNPRRSANVAVIIGLGIAFAVFSLSILASQATHDELALRNSIGADASVAPFMDAPDLAARIAAVPGVAGVTRVEYSSAQADFCCPSTVVLDPATYFHVAQPAPFYFQSPVGSEEAKEILATPGQALVSKAYYDSAYLEVGDRITLRYSDYNESGSFQEFQLNLTVGGVVRGLPPAYGGFGPGPGIFSDMPMAIYVGEGTYGPFAKAIRDFLGPGFSARFGTTVYLVDLTPEADWPQVKMKFLDLGGSVRIYEEEREALTSNPFVRSFRGFMDIQIAFIGVILTAGLGLVIYAASLERDQEFASMIARGCSGWQAAALLVGEAVAILLIGAAVGIAVGVGTAFAALQFIQPTTTESLIPYALVVPGDAVLFLGLAPLAMVLTAVLIAARTARMNVARVLKTRGG